MRQFNHGLAANLHELLFSSNWSLLVKFAGQFANVSQTYAGTGRLTQNRDHQGDCQEPVMLFGLKEPEPCAVPVHPVACACSSYDWHIRLMRIAQGRPMSKLAPLRLSRTDRPGGHFPGVSLLLLQPDRTVKITASAELVARLTPGELEQIVTNRTRLPGDLRTRMGANAGLKRGARLEDEMPERRRSLRQNSRLPAVVSTLNTPTSVSRPVFNILPDPGARIVIFDPVDIPKKRNQTVHPWKRTGSCVPMCDGVMTKKIGSAFSESEPHVAGRWPPRNVHRAPSPR